MSVLWYSKSAPSYQPKKAKSIIHPFTIRGFNGMTINPYQGCQHRCAYCYATYEWSPEFYDKIYAKSNAPEVLEKELRSWRSKTIDPVMVASATDAYQPSELKYELTRRCVQVLQKYNVPYYLFTKSTIIQRDLELHRRYAHNCFVVWSITTANEAQRRIIEPGTPPAKQIFSVIKKFTEAKITCVVNIDPIIPLVTDDPQSIEPLVDCCREAGVKFVHGEMLRLRKDIWERMQQVLAMLGVHDGTRRYSEIYGISEQLEQPYVSCNTNLASQVIALLRQKVTSCGLCYGFPNKIKAQAINKIPSTDQTKMISFLPSTCSSSVAATSSTPPVISDA